MAQKADETATAAVGSGLPSGRALPLAAITSKSPFLGPGGAYSLRPRDASALEAHVSSNPPTASVATSDSEATGARGARGAELVELVGAVAARQDMTARWVTGQFVCAGGGPSTDGTPGRTGATRLRTVTDGRTGERRPFTPERVFGGMSSKWAPIEGLDEADDAASQGPARPPAAEQGAPGCAALEAGATQEARLAESVRQRRRWMPRALQAQCLAMLRRVSLFSLLTEKEMRTVVAAAEMVTYRPGEAIIRQGEAGDYFYLLVAGGAVAVDERETAVFGLPRVLKRYGRGVRPPACPPARAHA